MKVKWNGNFQEKFFEDLGIPHEVVLFSGKLCKSLNISKANKSSGESAIYIFEGKTANGKGLSFSTPVQSTGKFCTIRPWKFPEIHIGIFGRTVSALACGEQTHFSAFVSPAGKIAIFSAGETKAEKCVYFPGG